MSRFRAFTFTINNYTSEDESSLLNLGHRYIVYGREVGESGTPHLQGYIVFGTSRSFKSLSSKMPRAHIEQAKGDSAANFRYCTKGGDYFEDGDKPASNKEKGQKGGAVNACRYKTARQAAQSGDVADIPDDLYTRHYKFYEREAKRARLADSATLAPAARHYWLHGLTGTGKSYAARNVGKHLGFRTYIKDPQSKWWDGYDGEEIVVIDDFDKYQVKQGGDMKRYLDIYPFPAQTKGGMLFIRPKVIIITSNYKLEEIWEDDGTIGPLRRRLNSIELFCPFRGVLDPELFTVELAGKIKAQQNLETVYVPLAPLPDHGHVYEE